MSESDDTDVLLLIPPDVFHVPSSDSDASSSDSARRDCGKTGVISELVGHMQSLESRISAIESRDNSLDVSVLNNSLDSQPVYPYYRQTLPRLSVSQSTSLQNTPVKPRKPLSVPATPSGYSTQNYTNSLKNDMKSGCYLSTTAISNLTTTNTLTRAKHDTLTSYSDSFMVPSTSCGIELSHAIAMSEKKESHSSLRPNDCCTSNLYYKPHNSLRSAVSATNLPNTLIGQQHTRTRIVQEMELSEVDELLQEMEATELELSKRINNSSRYQYYNELAHPILSTQTVDATSQEKETQHKLGTRQKLNFQSYSKEPQIIDNLSAVSQKKSNNAFPDISLPYSESFQLNESNKMISEFKTWEQNIQQPTSKVNEHTIESNIKSIDHLSNVSSAIIDNAKSKESMLNQSIVMKSGTDTNNAYIQSKDSTDPLLHVSESTRFPDMMPSKVAQNSNTEHLLDPCKTLQHNGNVHDDREKSVFAKNTVHVATNTDPHLRYLHILIYRHNIFIIYSLLFKHGKYIITI